MIQIYNIEKTHFDQNGDMSLFPSSASVHAVLNGTWEVTLEHPKDSEDRWKYIKEGAVVKMPSFNGEQLFRITHKEKSDSGISADLQPIFMDAADDCFLLDVRPTDKTGQQALDIMTAPNKKYTAETDITSTVTAYYQNKILFEAINGDDENSFVKRWGGEIVYDNYKAIINRHAGSDRGVEILYGKNIAENGMKEEVDLRNVVTRIIPQAYNGYLIDGLHMYNPNSVVQAMLDHDYDFYWKNTSSFESINTFITMNYAGLKDDVLAMLSGDKIRVNVNTFQNDITTVASKDDALTALIHLGYLAYDANRKMAYMPNHEVSMALNLLQLQ